MDVIAIAIEKILKTLSEVECEPYEEPSVLLMSNEEWGIVVRKKDVADKLPPLIAEGFRIVDVGKVTIH